jgi:polysaccharide deacetylase family protein (PEP-CTERM system associated)
VHCRSIVSVDVEDYFHVEAFAGLIPRATWGDYECRVERNTDRILDLLDDCRVTATFFILGWVAERYPSLVRKIAERGHEPACHSYWHRLIYKLTPDEFREDTLLAKDLIEQAAGVAIYGYRAPSFSITGHSAWALDVLAELGFQYDSSVFPVKHDVYGVPGAPRGPFRVETPFGPIVEFPIATFRCTVGPNLPVGGGGYLRMLPCWYTRTGVERAWREGLPVVSYVHPWELDPDQPRISGPLKSRLRHYTNLTGAEARLRRLLALDRFSSFRDSGLAQSAPAFSLKELAQNGARRGLVPDPF